MDGARFANAAAALGETGVTPADITWKAGVDVLTLGGTKNGLSGSEAVVFFKKEMALDFEYRLKQAGQCASKQRFFTAQWCGMLEGGAWLRHARYANLKARDLAERLSGLQNIRLITDTEANSVFVEMSQGAAQKLTALGWRFLPFLTENGFRFMCSWDTREDEMERLIKDVSSVSQTNNT